MTDARTIRNAQRRVNRARGNPLNWTDPASRHLHHMADHLATGKSLFDEPEYVAETMYAVLESLWKARAKLGGVR
jgi:hypothetical protein